MPWKNAENQLYWANIACYSFSPLVWLISWNRNYKTIWQNSFTVQHIIMVHLQKLSPLPKQLTHASKLNFLLI